MTFYLYSIYDPEIESFDTRITVAPLDETGQTEQFRRAFIKMDEQNKAFMEGKKAVYLGKFDDETGKIEQSSIKVIFTFEKLEKESQVVEGEEGQDKADA